MTSRIEGESVKSIASRSMPIPSPPAGGIPYSIARTKSWSKRCASWSPSSRAASCWRKRSAWASGSFSSENAFAISMPPRYSSKRSVNRGSPGVSFANGDPSTG